jgi:S-DNA-T family DNA segregation ATPase FtsK/SpoIIIE
MDGQHMSRSAQRRAAFRFCLTTGAWVACLFGWVAALSFDSADWPSTSVWPQNAPVHNLCGPVGAWVAHRLFCYLGIGVYALLVLLTTGVLAWSKGARLSDAWLRFVGLALICAVFSTSGAMLIPASRSELVSGAGGALGAAAAHFFPTQLGTTGTLILLAAAFVVGLLLAADELVLKLARWLGWLSRRSRVALARGGEALSDTGAAVATGVSTVSERLVTAGPDLPTRAARQLKLELEPVNEQEDEEDDESASAADSALVAGVSGDEEPATAPLAGTTLAHPAQADETPKVRKVRIPATFKGDGSRTVRHHPAAESYKLPGLHLLDEPPPVDQESIEILCREKAYVLEQTLNEFRLEVQVVAIETGPVITVFELKLAPGIKVSQVASLSNDMARALKAPAVRVVAPLPGKNTIGIEVPNIDKEKVRLREVMRLAGRRTEHYAIPLFLGKDASGQPLVYDLTEMPHLLIAGTTGSGKSVCVSSLIMSVLLTRSPAEVNMILVDPKVVELAMYKEVPHLICPIVTEVARAEAILDWATTKMDERYALFAEAGVKDIRAYNRLGAGELRERFRPASDDELERIPSQLPYIVIIVDELADLMMSSAKDVEFYLCRLAQKSRAVGIHLIVSTQRPQATVVTGLIKSNLPCRIGFRVASRLDSRIVLDQNGGEVLMGQGDMLFLPPGSHKLVRAQGTFVSDEELRETVKHCRAQCDSNYLSELTRAPSAGGEDSSERDVLFDKAVDIILQTGRGSVSLLQRRLTIGYGRASRLIDQMYEAGIVGEYKGSQAREVIVSKEEWDAARNQRDQEEAAEAAQLTSDS